MTTRIAYIERNDIDYRIKSSRPSRISLAAPSDAALLRAVMPDARTRRPKVETPKPVEPAKPTRQLMSKDKSREIMMGWLRQQTEPKSTYDMSEDQHLIEAMGKQFTSGTLWGHLSQMSKQGLVTCEKRMSSRNGSWARVAYWRAAQ